MRKQASKNILMKDGTVRRLPSDQCEKLIESKQAKRFISNTLYSAVKLGIEVKNFNDRDEKGTLKKRIQAAREKVVAKKHKAEAKKKSKEEADN